MESSDWRHYRRHLIVARRCGLLRRRRFEVWDRGSCLGSFRDEIRAERHVDMRLDGK